MIRCLREEAAEEISRVRAAIADPKFTRHDEPAAVFVKRAPQRLELRDKGDCVTHMCMCM